MKVIIYFKKLNSIGGVESWLYYLAKKYEFEFYYKVADPKQVERLSKYIKVKKYNGEKLVCDKFIVNYNPDIIDNVEAKEYIMMIHCDYSKVSFNPITHPKFTKYIGVSQHVCDVFTELTGIKAELCYNYVYLDKPQVEKDEKIHLISATRLTGEKGGWRIDKMCEILDKSGIDYDWTIYSNRKPRFIRKNLIIKEPKLDLTKEIASSSFLVQLSDAEAYCFSVIEALTLGTPVIVTDLPVFNELGINEENSIKVNMLLTNFNPEDIKKKFNFKYKQPKDNWSKYLPTEKTYNPKELIKVKVLKRYKDITLNRRLLRDQETEMTISRASYLENKGLICF